MMMCELQIREQNVKIILSCGNFSFVHDVFFPEYKIVYSHDVFVTVLGNLVYVL
jgi:hypothetical protein